MNILTVKNNVDGEEMFLNSDHIVAIQPIKDTQTSFVYTVDGSKFCCKGTKYDIFSAYTRSGIEMVFAKPLEDEEREALEQECSEIFGKDV